MKAFRFKLESYYNLKLHEEKNAWSEVLKQQSRVYQLEAAIDTIVRAIGGARTELSLGHNLSTAQIVEESIGGLSAKLRVLIKDKSIEEKTLEVLKQKFIEKKRDAKILDNLKDRKKAEFREKKSKQDQKDLEEIARTLMQSRDEKNE